MGSGGTTLTVAQKDRIKEAWWKSLAASFPIVLAIVGVIYNTGKFTAELTTLRETMKEKNTAYEAAFEKQLKINEGILVSLKELTVRNDFVRERLQALENRGKK